MPGAPSLHLQLRGSLEPALNLAEVGFPYDFRAVVMAGIGVSAAGAGVSASPAALSKAPRLCSSPSAVRSLMGDEGFALVDHVLGGCGLTQKEVGFLAYDYCLPGRKEGPARENGAMLRVVLAPADARAAVAAAAAAAAAPTVS